MRVELSSPQFPSKCSEKKIYLGQEISQLADFLLQNRSNPSSRSFASLRSRHRPARGATIFEPSGLDFLGKIINVRYCSVYNKS